MNSISTTTSNAAYAGSGSTTTGVLPLNPNALSTGQIEAVGEIDHWRVTLKAGTTYTFDMRSGTAGTDPLLRLRNADGSLVAENDDAGSKNGPAGLAFTPTKTGTYYVDASFDNGTTGGYELRASADDYSGDNTTTGRLLADGSRQTGIIQYGADADRFKVVLEAGTAYQFEARATQGGLQPMVSLYAADGSALGGALNAGGGKAQYTYVPASSGTYYVSVASTGATIGDYDVRATPIADDYAANTRTLGTVTPNGSAVSGTLERSGDIDYLKVSLTAGKSYVFSVQGSGSKGSVLDTFLRLRGADGRVLASDDDGAGTKNGGSQISFQAPTSGAYYLDISSDALQTGAYSVLATTDDYPAGSNTTGVVTVGGAPSNGSIECPGDVDWLRIDLRAGVLYDFNMEAASGSKGSAPGLSQPDLVLRAPDGSKAYGQGNGSKDQLSYVARTDGTYYLVAQARDGVSTGAYTLKASAVADDLPSSTGTKASVQVNGAGSKGRINAPADTDFFKVQLAAGTTYKFDLAGTDGEGWLVDTYLRLLAADGSTELAANDDGGSKNGSSSLSFKATASGTYYLEASGDGTHVGGYTLSAVTVAGAAQATAQPPSLAEHETAAVQIELAGLAPQDALPVLV